MIGLGKHRKDILVILVLATLAVAGTFGYYIGLSNSRFNEEAAISRMENYMIAYTNLFGKTTNCPFNLTGVQCRKENEADFRSILNFVNVPTSLFAENLTVNQAIEAYDKYQLGAKYILGLTLRDVCTR